jgi:hypothetical protein
MNKVRNMFRVVDSNDLKTLRRVYLRQSNVRGPHTQVFIRLTRNAKAAVVLVWNAAEVVMTRPDIRLLTLSEYEDTLS